MQKYFENLYKIMFEFDYSEIKEQTTMPLAVLTLVWSSCFLYVAKNSISTGMGGEIKYIVGLIFYLVGIFIIWFSAAIFFEFVAKIFGKAGKIRTLLTLSSYTLLPYLLIAPCEILKRFSDLGYFLGTKFEILLFFWVIFIYAKALAKTYDLENSSSYMFIFLPLVSLIFGFIWLIGSAFNLGYIYTV